MASQGRYFTDEQALEKKISTLCTVIGYAGITPLTLESGDGISSVTEEGVGEYKISLVEKFNALRGFEAMLIKATVEDYTFQIKEYDMNPTTGLPYITFYAITAGAKANLPNPSSVSLIIELKNSYV